MTTKKRRAESSNRGSDEDHLLRRESAYDLWMCRMPCEEIARRVGVTTRSVYRLIKEQQEINRKAADDRGDTVENKIQQYIDALHANILRCWQMIENKDMRLTSQNVSQLMALIATNEERIAKVQGLLIDRSKIEAELNGKMTLLDLIGQARRESGQ